MPDNMVGGSIKGAVSLFVVAWGNFWSWSGIRRGILPSNSALVNTLPHFIPPPPSCASSSSSQFKVQLHDTQPFLIWDKITRISACNWQAGTQQSWLQRIRKSSLRRSASSKVSRHAPICLRPFASNPILFAGKIDQRKSGQYSVQPSRYHQPSRTHSYPSMEAPTQLDKRIANTP